MHNDITKDDLLRVHPDYNAKDMRLHAALMSTNVNLADSKLKLLTRGRNEAEADFKFRAENTPWAPQSPAVVSAYLGALLQKRPMLEKGARELVDSRATTQWRVDLNKSLVVFGRAGLLLDRPSVKAPERTLEDVNAEIEKERVFVYNGPNILDWKFDENENLTMVKVREFFDARESWRDTNADRASAQKFFIWELIGGVATLHAYTLMGETVTDITSTVDQPHADFAGRLPFELGFVDSVLGHIADLDVDSVRVLSDLRYDMYQHTHLMMKVHSDDPESWAKKGIRLGANEVIGLRRQTMGDVVVDEDVNYLTVPSNVIQDLELRYKRTVDEIYKIAGIMRQGADQFASGVSVQFRFAIGQEKQLQEIVDAAERMERRLRSMAGAGTVTYNRNFSLDPMAETQITDAVIARGKGIPTFQRVKLAEFVKKHIPEDINKKDLRAIEKELEEWEPNDDPFGHFMAEGLDGSPVDTSGSASPKKEDEDAGGQEGQDPQEGKKANGLAAPKRGG